MKKIKVIITFLLVFTFGLVAGYVLTIYSLFPASNGNFIFAGAPELDVHNRANTDGMVAHLSLIHDMSLLREQSWYYELILSDGQGENVWTKKFDPETVGGHYNLNSTGNLKWDEDAKAVTVCINDFDYRFELSGVRIREE